MSKRLGLTLSGGGIRAAAFHLGVLKRLADEDLLEEVTEISTVSGGSLLVGALFSAAGLRWPSSKEFRDVVYPKLHSCLTKRDLFSLKAIGLFGLFRFNFRILYRRAAILAQLLQDRWGVHGTLAQLPEAPRWSICTTNIETGKSWRFSKRMMGDWVFGRHFEPTITLAEACTASAAVPYVIGAMKISLPETGWWQTKPITHEPVRRIDVARKVRLWDGGVYENLGLESIFKPGRSLEGCDFLLCCDASAPLLRKRSSPIWSLLKGHLPSPRLLDVSSDQIRMLRYRMLMSALETKKIEGAFITMGSSMRELDYEFSIDRPAADYDRYLNEECVAAAYRHPTDLAALSFNAFQTIVRHGYETANAALHLYCGDKAENKFW